MNDADGSAALARAQAARAALLKRRLSGKGGVAEGIPKRDPSIDAPASSAQTRLYFLSALRPESAAYHMNAPLRLSGEVDINRMQRSLDRLWRRHAALRTTFSLVDGQLLQRNLPPEPLPLEVIRPDSAAESSEAVQREALVAAVRRPFDLHRGPLFRAELMVLGPGESVLLLTMHHIIADEWSLEILLEELAAAYNAEQDLEASASDAVPALDYADFASWQQDRLAAVTAEELPYWTSHLGEGFTAPALPVTGSSPVDSDRGVLLHRLAPGSLGAAVEALARECRCTPFMVLIAAFEVLLSRYTGASRVAFATPAANRERPELERLVGLFLNTVIIHETVDDSLTFREHLERVRKTTQAAYAHQNLPFEVLVDALHPQREGAANPLFQVMLVEESATDESLLFDGLQLERWQLDTGFAKLDLTCFVRFRPDALYLALEYRQGLFSEGSMQQLLEALETLLLGASGAPDLVLSDLALNSASRTRELLDRGAGMALPEGQSLTLLPQQLKEVSGDAIALVDAAAGDGQTRTLSYQALRKAAADTAWELVEAGVRPGDYLPLLASPGSAMIIGLMAAWNAGAAYVPLEPEAPRGRHQAVLDNLHATGRLAPVVLVDGTPNELPAEPDQRVIGEAPAAPADWVPYAANPADPAYVIHTSGSTGEPKGVRISHRALAHSTAARGVYYAQPPQRYLLLSAFGFDSSVAGIWWTLGSGGTLVLASASQRKDPREILRLLREQQITHTLLLPGLYQLVLQAQAHSGVALSALETVIVAGEACAPVLVAEHQRQLSGVALFNEYGPTEATVWATVHRCVTTDGSAPSVPIGRTVPGMQALVLDRGGQLLPQGIPGELCLAGDALSDGYLNASELTRRRFPDHPLVPGGRIYRTGDRVRINSAGLFEFAGRIDRQIKWRGHRLDPLGLEAVICRVAEVDEAHVALDTANGPERLCAWLRSDSDVAFSALRARLERELPAWMLPSHFMVLETFPRHANGKLDAGQLRRVYSPGADGSDAAGGEVPQGETELALAKLWEAVLSVPIGDRHSDFFALGGHSLSGVGMMLRLEQMMNVSLPLSALFEAPTLAALAARIDGARAPVWPAAVSPVQLPSGSQTSVQEARPALFCVHNGARVMAKALGRQQPVYLLFEPASGEDLQTDSVERTASVYLSGMQQVQAHGPYYLIGFSVGCQIAVEMAQRLQAQGEDVALLALCEPPMTDAALFYRLQARIKRFELQAAKGFGAKTRWFLGQMRQSLGMRWRRWRWSRQLDQAQRSNSPAPEKALAWRLERHYAAMYWAYEQSPWEGDTVIFLPESAAPAMAETRAFWSSLFTGRLELLLVKGAKRHQDLIGETSGRSIALEIGQLLKGHWPASGKVYAGEDNP